MRKTFLILFYNCLCAIVVFSQPIPKGKLFVLNEGTFSTPGSVGIADFFNNTYTDLAVIPAYGNQITYGWNHLFVVDGDGNVRLMDIQGNTTDSIMGIGARSVAFYGSELLVACMEAPYFKVYEYANIPQMKYSLDSVEIRSSREEMVVLGDKAFVSGYYGDSAVYVVNLLTHEARRIATPPNPYQIEECGGRVVVGCFSYNSDFTTNTTIVTIDPDLEAITHQHLMLKASTFTASDDLVYQQSDVTGRVLTYSPVTQDVDSLGLSLFAYTLMYDRNTSRMFYSTTDFSTYGTVNYIKTPTATGTDIAAGISPRSFYFFADTLNNSLSEVEKSSLCSFYPNPTQGILSLDFPPSSAIAAAEIMDITGKSIQRWENLLRENILDVSELPKGLYLLTVSVGNRKGVYKLIKE